MKYLILIIFAALLIPAASLAQSEVKALAWYSHSVQQAWHGTNEASLSGGVFLSVSIKSSPFRTGFLVNNTEQEEIIDTQDGSLIMIMEAKDSLGVWRPIEYWLWSTCGNSYFDPLQLKANHVVSFKIPEFFGEIETTCRLKLTLGERGCLYSEQFEEKVGQDQLYSTMELDYAPGYKMDIYLRDCDPN